MMSKNKVIRLVKYYNYHLATKVVLLLIRLKIRFSSTLFIPYFTNKTTSVAQQDIFSFPRPHYLIPNKTNIPFTDGGLQYKIIVQFGTIFFKNNTKLGTNYLKNNIKFGTNYFKNLLCLV